MSIWDEDPKPRRKPRWVGLTVALLIFGGLVAIAVFGTEQFAKDTAAGLVKGPVSTALGADSSEVEVHFGEGFLLGQIVTGSVDEVHASADPVTVAGGIARLSLIAMGVPLSAPVVADSVQADLAFGADGLAGLATTLAGESATGLTLGDGVLVLSATAIVGGAPVPAELTLQPSVAEDGQLVLTVVAATINGQETAVESLAAGALGPEAAVLVAPRAICVAEFLPAGLGLTTATVTGQAFTMSLSGTQISLSSGTKGTCEVAV